MISKEVDTWFLLWAGALVFFMQAGFAMLEAGIVSSKNVKNILVKNILDIALAGLIWFLVGHGIAYGGAVGESRDKFIGLAVGDGEDLFALHIDDKNATTYTEHGYDWASWFFQFAFCAVAATIVSGAVAERTRIEAYLVYTSVITGLIYPVVVHWGWSPTGAFSPFNSNVEDALKPVEGGAMDFAGSTIVHMTGGIAALVGAAVVGPRTGRFGADGSVRRMPMHNFTLIALGTFVLWFGWYGFNCGSTLGINGFGRDAGRVAVTTTMAPCAAALLVTVAAKLRSGVWDLGAVCNGVLAGLVSITAGCAAVDPWAAIVIGLVGGLVYVGASALLVRLRVDDPLDAFAVHGACGAWGTVAVGLFAPAAYAYNRAGHCGAFMPGCDGKLLGVQLAFVLAVGCWVAATSAVMFFALSKLGLLRVDRATEEAGLDGAEHGGHAYDIRRKSEVMAAAEVEAGLAALDVKGKEGKKAADAEV